MPGAAREYVLYLRKSKGRAGIARQRQQSQAHCERIGGQIVAEFVDADRTAFSKIGAGPARRDNYQAMLAMLRADKRPLPLGVLAWHADRLHRNPDEMGTFLEVCATGQHPMETARTGTYDLTTPTGRKRFRTDVVDAAYEVDHMTDRIEAAKNEAVAEGRWLGGRRPFGYEADGETVRPAEAAELELMAEAILSGISLNGVARDLNDRGIKTSTGKSWDSRGVRRVLLRPRNAGIMEHHGEEVGPALWDGVIDETTWRTVVALLNDPTRRTSPGSERRWLLSGIAECGVCAAAGIESRLRVGTAGTVEGGARATVPAYRCRSGGAKHVVRNAEHLDRFVFVHVIERMSQDDAANLISGTKTGGAARARLIEREALWVREQEVAEMQATGDMTKAQVITSNRMTAARRAELDAADAAEARVTALTPFREGDPRHVWEGLVLDQRRAVIRELFRVVVLPSTSGRPRGWTPEYGKIWGYFSPEGVEITGLI